MATYNNSSLPVYVDGFQTNMAYFQFLSPAEIDRIEVLKDAAALAPFGMRGANGVIWVTTSAVVSAARASRSMSGAACSSP